MFSDKKWNKSEAQLFREKLIIDGVPAEDILVQDRSANTLEDVLFSKEIIYKTCTSSKNIILVAKPIHQLRAFSTFKKQLPQYNLINAPAAWDSKVDTVQYNEFRALEELKRLKTYAEKGDIAEVSIPKEFTKFE